MATTIIINKATYDADYAKEQGTLMFAGKFWDCKSYVDSPKLRKKLNLKGRGRILAILVRQSDDPEFVNIANKDVTYKYPVCVLKNMDGAKMGDYGRWETKYPIGNVVVVLKE